MSDFLKPNFKRDPATQSADRGVIDVRAADEIRRRVTAAARGVNSGIAAVGLLGDIPSGGTITVPAGITLSVAGNEYTLDVSFVVEAGAVLEIADFRLLQPITGAGEVVATKINFAGTSVATGNISGWRLIECELPSVITSGTVTKCRMSGTRGDGYAAIACGQITDSRLELTGSLTSPGPFRSSVHLVGNWVAAPNLGTLSNIIAWNVSSSGGGGGGDIPYSVGTPVAVTGGSTITYDGYVVRPVNISGNGSFTVSTAGVPDGAIMLLVAETVSGTALLETDANVSLHGREWLPESAGEILTLQYVASLGYWIETSRSITYDSSAGFLAKNNSGTTMPRGTIVYISGASGNNPLISRADYTTEALSAGTVGMVYDDIPNNEFGHVITVGLVRNLNTFGLTAGAPIYLGTNGTWTTTKPSAPNHIVKIGNVVRVNSNNGSIQVQISNGWELSELHDVQITSAAKGNLIVRNAANLWQNFAVGADGYVLTAASGQSTGLTWSQIIGLTDGNKGSITVSGGGSTWLLNSNTVTNNELADMMNNRIKGRIGSIPGDPQDLTGTEATTLLDIFTSSLKGLAPASGGGSTNFLRADGTWAAPPAGTVTSVSVATANGLAGNVANATTTPTITLSTTVTGLLKGDGYGAIVTAIPGTDFAPAGNYVTLDTVQTITAAKVIDVNTSSNTPALRITQRGADESFRVEDSLNPDSTPFVINSSGQVGIGISPPAGNPGVAALTLNGNAGYSSTESFIARFIFPPDQNNPNPLHHGRILFGQAQSDKAFGLAVCGLPIGVGAADSQMSVQYIDHVTGSSQEIITLQRRIGGQRRVGIDYAYPQKTLHVGSRGAVIELTDGAIDSAPYDAAFIVDGLSSTSATLGVFRNIANGTILTVGGNNVGVGTTSPSEKFSVGSSSQFRVNNSGNITRINNVTYNWPSSGGAANTYLRNDGSGNLSWATTPAGTVTGVSVVNTNGFSGTVANATTTPAITLSTTVSGLLKGNGTAVSAAVSGSDYAPPTSGAGLLMGDNFGGFNNVSVGTGLSFSGGILSNTEIGLTDGDKGDITVSLSGTSWTVDNGVITNAKLADVATATFKGRTTAGTGTPEDLSGTQATALLDTFTDSLKGLTPASGGGTTNFLRADGTWAAPPSTTGGTVTSVSVVSANGFSGSVANATTTPAITLTTIITGVLKGNGTAISAAVAGTDFAPPTSGTAILKANGTGGFVNAQAGTDYAPATSGTSILSGNNVGGFTNVTVGTGLSFVGGTLTSAIPDGDKGDITVSGTGTVFTVDNGVITNAKLANAGAFTFKGRPQSGIGAVEDMSQAQATAMIDTFTSTLKGLAPASGGGTTNFLRADGTWASPAGSGTVTTVSVVSANGLAGTVANPTTTPAITLSTTVTGILKGNGTAISAAVAGTDYGTVTTASVVSANGFAGTVANASTTPAITLSTTVTGLLKGNGTAISAAVADVDYLAVGPAYVTSSTVPSVDNALVRYDLTSGKIIQSGAGVILSDSGEFSRSGNLAITTIGAGTSLTCTAVGDLTLLGTTVNTSSSSAAFDTTANMSLVAGTTILIDSGSTLTMDATTSIRFQNAGVNEWVIDGTSLQGVELGAGAQRSPLIRSAETATSQLASPLYSFVSDTNTGMTSSDADTLTLVTGGSSRLQIDTTAVSVTLPVRATDGSTSVPAYSFTNDSDSGISVEPAKGLRLIKDGYVVISADVDLEGQQTLLGGSRALSPLLTFVADPDTGIGYNAATPNNIDFWAGGTAIANINTGGFAATRVAAAPGSVSAPGFTFIGDPDTGIFTDTANRLCLGTGGRMALRVDASAVTSNYNPQIICDDGAMRIGHDTSNRTLTLFTNGLNRVTVEGNGDYVAINSGLVYEPGNTVNLTIDSQAVTVGGRSYIKLSSNSGSGTSRTFTLSNGVRTGQVLILHCIANSCELQDTGNVEIAGTMTFQVNYTLSLIWDGADWIETARSLN